MDTSSSRSPHRPDPLLATLTASFAVFRDVLPLAIGIHKAIKERFRKAAEQKKAEQAAKERQGKLQQLADKFNSRSH